MPSYLDFNTTKVFRDYLISRTLNQPNGPQTFTSSNYVENGTNNYPNIYQGTVEDMRTYELTQSQNLNVYKPTKYFINETVRTLPRKANLSLYPYFVSSNHNLIGILSSGDDTTESELYRFAAHYIKTDPNGPVFSRVTQNLESATIGRFRLADALNGDTATAINLLTGREPLIEPNYKVTVSNSLVGQAVDFVQTVAGTQLPFSTIPGDYLTDPRNPINYRPTPSTELGAIVQDVTGAIGSLIGIQRRPKTTRKPSDLLIEHTSNGQLNRLYDLLSYSKYAPNYTTTARSQNSSKIFGFVDKIAQGAKNILGTEAPAGKSYIGDDRSDNVINAMTDQFQRPVHSTYYLGLKFDPIQTNYFEGMKGLSEGGDIASKLTWYGINSKKNNKLGANNKNYTNSQETNFLPTLSTNTTFREGSILAVTQDILNTMPPGGQARTHVGNVIDQTTRVFKEGNKMLSRGSAIKYTDKFTGIESGVEYCRVWTKDRPYYTYRDTMKVNSNIRKMDGSVMGGESRVWNLNYAPMSNGRYDFSNSTNIVSTVKGTNQTEDTFYAKKYMFSIENLAWKTSNKPGFTVQDLPACERGSNGGRVMWFPPYDLKVSEANAARWESNSFLGRPEPIYTYQNTERSGTISFKVVVDHPSILNLLVREELKNKSDEEADNYINAFFAGCQDVDLYALIDKFPTLSPNDLELITKYLNENGDPNYIEQNKTILEPIVQPQPEIKPNPTSVDVAPLMVHLRFDNDYPKIEVSSTTSKANYEIYYDSISNDNYKTSTKNKLINGITSLYNNKGTKNAINDINVLQLTPNDTLNSWITGSTKLLDSLFVSTETGYTAFKTSLANLKNDLTSGLTGNIKIGITSSCSAVADNTYNMALSVRRTDSIIQEVLAQISNGTQDSKLNINKNDLPPVGDKDFTKEVVYTFKELGYSLNPDNTLTFITHSKGETAESDFSGDCGKANFYNQDLKVASHLAFGCRQSIVNIEGYKRNLPNTNVNNGNNPTPNDIKYKTIIVPGGKQKTTGKRKLPFDLMKKIISKTLTEGYYFKKLEETDPLIFSSLREKLKYFHPGFHSMTPEGLNSRLTFLHQCIRPGDTVPIKGVSDEHDLNARNTTFGPPPICVLRIGDFYHSKIIIESIGITYDDNVWDLNPEGIGIQPMIANVNLQVKFIGGQGLEKPVERLQNALSSNFYGNTEMYDERSEITNRTMNGKETESFTKEFLQKLNKTFHTETTPNTSTPNNEIKKGQYIGSSDGKVDDLTGLIDGDNSVFVNADKYFMLYSTLYNSLLKIYGPKVIGVLLSPTYRTIKTYEIKTPTSTTNIDLFGNYSNGTDSTTLINKFGDSCLTTINNMTDLSSIFDFSSSAFKNKVGLISASNDILKKYLPSIINTKIKNDLVNDTRCREFESLRNNLIVSLDKVNFLVKYHYDGKIVDSNGDPGLKVTLDGFMIDDFYNQYSNVVDYISNNTSLFYDNLDNSINFNLPVVSESDLKSILQVLLVDQKDVILNLYKAQPTTFSSKVIDDIEGNLIDFLKNQPTPVKFKFKKFPKRTNNKKFSFNITLEDSITDQNMLSDLKKLNSSTNVEPNKLNYYRKK